MIDIIVAGGGPVGLAAAIGARQAGLSVVVLEPRRGPIDKACGEGIMPGGLLELERLGVSVASVGQPLTGIRFLDGARRAEALFLRPGAGVRRTALHRVLHERAEALDVQCLRRRAGRIDQDERGVGVAGLRGRYLLAADGLHSPLRRRLGLEADARPREPRFGVRRHFAMPPWTDRVEIHLAADAEAYVTPVSKESVGVALLYSPGTADRGPGRAPSGRFAALLERFPELRERLGPPVGREHGAGPFERRVRQRVAGRVLLVGDAAGYLDPLTGEGIRLGLASARLAIDAIVADRPARYERAWWREARASWLLTDLLLRVRRSPRLAPALVPTLRRVPKLFSLGLRILAGC